MEVSENLKLIADNITWLRNYYGISKKRMAELLGISISSLNRIEKGEIPKRLGVEVIFNIYDNFGIYPSVLMSRRMDEDGRTLK